MKTLLLIAASIMLVGIASASVGEYAGFLYFNFTQTNQKLTSTWTLVNTGNTPVSFTVVLPSYNTSSLLIQTSVANGTIPANMNYPIQVSVTELAQTHFSGSISAAFKNMGNLNLQIDKQMYVNSHPSSSSMTTSVVTSVATTSQETTIPSTMQSTTVPTTTSSTPDQSSQAGSEQSGSKPNNNTQSSILPAVGIGIATIIVAGIGISFFRRGKGRFQSFKR